MTKNQGPPVDAEWYPDVAAEGSLATALEKAARETGADIGGVEPMTSNVFQGAWMPSVRGGIVVNTVRGKRLFSISMANDGTSTAGNSSTRTTYNRQSWAYGATDDLSDVVRAADSWRRGLKLRELQEAFPFMTYSRMALANEDGNAREVLWDLLIDEPDYRQARPLLQAARADDQLGQMWPSVSHTFWVYFAPRDGSGAVARVRLNDGSYVVGRGGGWEDSDDSTTAHTVDEAVATVKALLAGQ
jgi:hypothetical protein